MADDDDTKLIEERIAAARRDIRQTLDVIAYRTDVRARLPEYGRHVATSLGLALRKRVEHGAVALLTLSLKAMRGIGFQARHGIGFKAMHGIGAATTTLAQIPFFVSLRNRQELPK